MRGFTVLLVASAFLPFSALCAQVVPTIEPGARVRVTAPDCLINRQVGTIEPTRGDTLVIAFGSSSIRCLHSNVTNLEVSRGRNTSIGRVLIGAGLGVLGGGLLGAGVGYALEQNGCYEDCGLVTAGSAVVGAGGGLVIGTVIGALTKTDRWEQVPLDRLRVSFTPKRDGRFALGLTVSF